MILNELDADADVLKSQSELATGCFIAHPDLRVIDDVPGRTQDALGHVKRVIREAVRHAHAVQK